MYSWLESEVLALSGSDYVVLYTALLALFGYLVYFCYGACIVDPDDAHVIPEMDITWYGNDTDARNRAPTRASWIQLGFGHYRFRERLIRPATALYALRWFRTVHTEPAGEFNFEQNGKIQKQEWKAIRAAARKQVLVKLNSEDRGHHILSRPQDNGHPYILSANEEEELVARKKIYAYVSLCAAFLLLVTRIVISTMRPFYPI
ncbi:MAG: hypothetical protein DRQ59_04115 [Gammaproteobacteria bacterium]|nr:MAG: hypothetical protein DRQ59_04115 [Gammaproteobacteria bacterium]